MDFTLSAEDFAAAYHSIANNLSMPLRSDPPPPLVHPTSIQNFSLGPRVAMSPGQHYRGTIAYRELFPDQPPHSGDDDTDSVDWLPASVWPDLLIWRQRSSPSPGERKHGICNAVLDTNAAKDGQHEAAHKGATPTIFAQQRMGFVVRQGEGDVWQLPAANQAG